MTQVCTQSAHSQPNSDLPTTELPLRRAAAAPVTSAEQLALAETGVGTEKQPIDDGFDDDWDHDRLIQAKFGNFRVMRKLSQGGMGVVYEVKHPTIERRAVVKVLHPRYAQDPEYAARFLNEARVVNIIGHPGLVEIFDYGQLADGTVYIVMEFLQGQSLHEHMQKQRPPHPEHEVLPLALQLARALSAAHGKGVIHRELEA